MSEYQMRASEAGTPAAAEKQAAADAAKKAELAQVEVIVSAARRRLNLTRQQSGDQKSLVRVEFGGESFWIKPLNWSQITRAHLMASRNGEGALDIVEDDEDLRAFTIAALETAVFEDEFGQTAYFTLADATVYADSTTSDEIAFVRFLLDNVLAVNPNLVPKSVRGAEIPRRKTIPGAVPKAPLPASTTSTSTNGANGSHATNSNSSPAASQSASASSPHTGAAKRRRSKRSRRD